MPNHPNQERQDERHEQRYDIGLKYMGALRERLSRKAGVERHEEETRENWVSRIGI